MTVPTSSQPDSVMGRLVLVLSVAGTVAALSATPAGTQETSPPEAGEMQGSLLQPVEPAAGDDEQTPAVEPLSGSTAPPMCIDKPVSQMGGANSTPGSLTGNVSSLAVGVLKRIDETNKPEEGAYLVNVMCRDPDIDCTSQADCVYDQPSDEGFQWRYPGEDPVVASQEDLVADLMVELEDALPQPTVETNPPADQATIVHLPTFVTVTNWTGTYETDEICHPADPNLCLSATAEPTMVFDPGEPGVEPISCEGPGQPYQPGIYADVFQQATWDETCSYAYTLRSGVGDRPEQWPGQVTVTWDITWDPDTVVGTDAISLSTDLSREVNEVQTVVTN